MAISSVHESIQFQLLETFPLLLPQNKQFTRYDGFIKVEDKQWRVSLDVPNYPSLNGVRIQYGWDMEVILKDDMNAVSMLSQASESIPQYLKAFCKILASCLHKRRINCGMGLHGQNASEQLKTLMSDDLIVSELKSLGSCHVSKLSADLRTVCIVAQDIEGSIHEMMLEISQSYPNSPGSDSPLAVANTDLPESVCKHIQKETNIPAAYRCFLQQLLNLSTIWKQLELLDSHSWVIDPSHPKKADLYRRIFIDAPKVMAQISWNPLHPMNKPEILFQGAESEVEAFRDNYEANMEKWSQSCDILVNICRVLNIEKLPIKEERSNDVDLMQRTGECSICMCERLNGSLPSISCGKCLYCFHASCLFQWFGMVSMNRVVHNHITGDCPNCETLTCNTDYKDQKLRTTTFVCPSSGSFTGSMQHTRWSCGLPEAKCTGLGEKHGTTSTWFCSRK